MEVEIDTELLIRLIEERPCLWDRTLEEYKLKAVTIEAWNEVFRLLNPDFDSMSVIERREFGNVITRRWRNIKDSYLKSRKRPYVRKSGTPLTSVKKYIFHDELQFLHKVYRRNPSRKEHFTEEENSIAYTHDSSFKGKESDIKVKQEGNFSEEEYDIPIRYECEYYCSEEENKFEDEKVENKDVVLSMPSAEDYNPKLIPETAHSVQHTKPIQYIKPVQYIQPVQQGNKRKYDDIESKLFSALEKLENPSPHVSFMNGLLPTLNNLTPEQTLDFQLGVLKLLKNITSTKSAQASKSTAT